MSVYEYLERKELKKQILNVNKDCCHIYSLKAGQKVLFKKALPSIFCSYYIDDDEIKLRMQKTKKNFPEIISTCIPDVSNIMSCEFGEIISTELLEKTFIKENNQYLIYNPKKLRWKEDRNKAAHKTDVVLIGKQKDSYFIISGEVKTKASESNFNPVMDMLDGLREDNLSRLTKSIYWIKEKEVRFGKKDDVDLIESVVDQIKNNIKIEKKYHGIVVLDSSLLEDELKRDINAIIKGHSSTVESMKDMLVSIGAQITDKKFIDFTNVTEEQVLNIKAECSKKKRQKEKIYELYKQAYLRLKNEESCQILFIVLDGLEKLYKHTYKNIIKVGGDIVE